MSQRSIRVVAIGPTHATSFLVSGLTAVGGRDSGGIAIDGLKYKDDYAVLSPSSGSIAVHPLKGKTKGPLALEPLAPIAINELTLMALPEPSAAENTKQPNEDAILAPDVQELIQTFSGPQDLTESLSGLLRTLIARLGMEKGLVIARTVQGSFDVVAQLGVDPKEPWLTETLIQDTLKTRRGTLIQNVYGSAYDTNKSLMATGFLSVFAWPLVLRGEAIGVAVVGSRKPHAGLNESEKRHAETLVQLASLALHFTLRDRKLREELAALRKSFGPEDSPVLTQDSGLLETCRLAKRIATTDLAVLIQGETGVGKELMANWIHQQSDRRAKPFVAVNCGAIPSELLESLLFGHRKGAFTSATSDQIGKFQLADGGTLFLDEIGDLPESLQVKLLRVLQEKQIEPLGASKPSSVDVRVIAASHKALPDLMAKGRFREDLYYRLAEITLVIPPLRERCGDVGLLAASFLKRFAPERRFSPEAWEWLPAQPWRGNVRELMSAIKRAAILAPSDEIRIEDFLHGVPGAARQIRATDSDEHGWLGGANLEDAKSRFVMTKVSEALKRADGKRNRAAELLGITPRTLFRYLEEHRGLTDVSAADDRNVTT